MIKITITSGPYAGAEIVPADASEYFRFLILEDWDWEADYSLVTDEEKVSWQEAEVPARLYQFLRRGKSVFFYEKEYRARDEREAAIIMDDIADSLKILGQGSLTITISDDRLIIGD